MAVVNTCNSVNLTCNVFNYLIMINVVLEQHGWFLI